MKKTIREVISEIKKGLKEVNADSRLTSKFIYSKLMSKSQLILQRESNALRLTNATEVYQTLSCVNVIDIPAIDPKCKITSKLRIYRTAVKIPELFFNDSGPMIRSIRSLDRYGKDVIFTTFDTILRTKQDSNSKWDKAIYAFYENGYIYPTEKLPLRVEGLYKEDVSNWCNCDCREEDEPCVRFLDKPFYCPEKLVDPIITLVIQDLINYKKIPEQQVIDKNSNT